MAISTRERIADFATPAAFPAIPPGELKSADYLRLARTLREAPHDGVGTMRVAVLASHTLQFVEPFLAVESARLGIRVECFFGGFGQFEQEVADAGSALHRFAPTALVLALRPEDADPDAVIRYHATAGTRFESLTEDVCGRLGNCIGLFRERATAPVFVANFAMPALAPLSVFDATADSLTSALARANERLRDIVRQHTGAIIWDYAGLVRSRGDAEWTDPRLWALSRAAVATRHQPALAKHLARTLAGATRPSAKCLVLDLDNTLWGGVIGDDGMEGIRLGDDFPGSAFKAFQRRVLSLKDRGILLAVVSKNDPDIVEQAFREHPEMLIRWEDLASTRINWEPKSRNLREIAEELNIGADALVLFDDNPVERAEVRANAPEVGVIDAPTDPLAYEAALLECSWFDQITLSSEDRARTATYQEERHRRLRMQQFTSVDDYLLDLDMVAEIGGASSATLARIAQLVGKTNQFNLTTRRHSDVQIAAMAGDRDHRVTWLRLTDRFGDQGLVAAAILGRQEADAVVDTFVMSCRVMNRRVEQALMAHLAVEARAMGCGRLIGEFLPTRKNGIVRDFYRRLGFVELNAGEPGVIRYALDLGSADIAWPVGLRRGAHA
jgi:FkbH-like protein